MLTIRLHRPGSVAHLATHDSKRGWHSLCTLLWEGSEWIGHDQPGGPALVTLGESYRPRTKGRALHLEDLRDVPDDVRLCSWCVTRHQWAVAAVEMALARRRG